MDEPPQRETSGGGEEERAGTRPAARSRSHVPVMPAEVLEFLAPQAGGTYVDFTVGAGGHARLIAERLGPTGRLIGFDKDPDALLLAGRALEGVEARVELVQASFAEAPAELARLQALPLHGALADLGVSSMQLDRPERGFSFAAEGPLDMRMDPSQELTAAQVVNEFSERELADLIYQFGEERRSRRIARAIVRSRPLKTTVQLAGVIAAVTRPMYSQRTAIHPATRSFQALRIFVNSEIHDLTVWLSALPGLLAPSGRAVVISFHSLEDRPVKESFRAWAREGLYEILTRHVGRASEAETEQNPRSRSAKLRAVQRTDAGWKGTGPT